MTHLVRDDLAPAAFRARVQPYLMRDEARHNLMLGLLGVLAEDPEAYAEKRLWLVERVARDAQEAREETPGKAASDAPREVVGVALQTPPRPIVLAAPAAEGALERLAAHLAEAEPQLPGVVAALPEADDFAAAYLARAGGAVVERMDQGLFVLERVEDLPPPEGRARRAGLGDLELCVRWFLAFHDEATPQDPLDEAQLRRGLRKTLTGAGTNALWLWEREGEVVSLAGWRPTSPNGARVGPVYTPPERRGRGYATALVAEVSRRILAEGARYGFLYTDLANPTSNAIYRRIGYRQVLTSAMLGFGHLLPDSRDDGSSGNEF